jgi:DNA-directed RNA polymerase subunit RPC12/RpoP
MPNSEMLRCPTCGRVWQQPLAVGVLQQRGIYTTAVSSAKAVTCADCLYRNLYKIHPQQKGATHARD